MAGLRTLLKKDENVKLFAISVDPPEASKELAGKLASDKRGEINFPLLSDPNHVTIDAYGLHDPAYDGEKLTGIPHPAVYVIDKKASSRGRKSNQIIVSDPPMTRYERRSMR